jgi:hypothetical protein
VPLSVRYSATFFFLYSFAPLSFQYHIPTLQPYLQFHAAQSRPSLPIVVYLPFIFVTSHYHHNSYQSQLYFRGEKTRKYGCFWWLLRWWPSWSRNGAVTPYFLVLQIHVRFLFIELYRCHMQKVYIKSSSLKHW